MTKKTEEEIAQERALAQEQLEAILSTSRPKNLGEGLSSGINNIVSGAVGAAGVAVLAPTVGLAMGLQSGGILGGAIGIAGGAIVGVLGAAAVAVGGVVSGVTQIARGFGSIPTSITAPRQGKWWNERLGQWILTDMTQETSWIQSFPNENDDDILGQVQSELDSTIKVDGAAVAVVDMFYYDCLEIPATAELSAIKRQYYLLARKYHPDKNPNDTVAAEKFKNIAEAYQVLSDPQLRKKYDTDGRGGLSADKTSVSDNDLSKKVDPTLLFAFLFGSDQFSNYIGRLSTATSASVGDSPKISIADAKELQKRRVTRLAVALINKITPWVDATNNEDAQSIIEAEWTVEGDTLSKASFGHQLVTTIGKVGFFLYVFDVMNHFVYIHLHLPKCILFRRNEQQCYNLMAVIYEGSIDSGHGLPSIAQWAAKTQASFESKNVEQKGKMEQLRAGLDMIKLQAEIQQKLAKATTDEEKAALNDQLTNASMEIMLRVLWTTTVVDITATIQETTQMVFFDTSVTNDIHLRRVAAVKRLGSLWMDLAEPLTTTSNTDTKDARQLYEEAAFAAMLETVKRQDEAAHQSFKQ